MTQAPLLNRLRKVCRSRPEAAETVKWRHPTFVAGGKVSAVLDEYGGRVCIAFRAAPSRQAQLIRDQRFYAAPYTPAHGWVCMHADQAVDWKEVAQLQQNSYRLVAVKRMLNAMGEGAQISKKRITRRLTTRGA